MFTQRANNGEMCRRDTIAWTQNGAESSWKWSSLNRSQKPNTWDCNKVQ